MTALGTSYETINVKKGAFPCSPALCKEYNPRIRRDDKDSKKVLGLSSIITKLIYPLEQIKFTLYCPFLLIYPDVKFIEIYRQGIEEDYFKLLRQLGLEKEEKLINLKPENYIGLAEKLAKQIK